MAASAVVFLSTFFTLLLSALLAASSAGDFDESCSYTASDIDSNWASALGVRADEDGVPPSFGAVPVVGTVKRVAWDHTDPDFNRKMMARLTPVILTGSPVSKWEAIGKWTPDYVADVVGHDTPLYATFSSDGNFLFHSDSKAKTADPSYTPPNKCVCSFDTALPVSVKATCGFLTAVSWAVSWTAHYIVRYLYMRVGDFVRMIQRNHSTLGTKKRLYVLDATVCVRVQHHLR